jgi:two-component system, OmpR family, sensor histidine kinase BaeS
VLRYLRSLRGRFVLSHVLPLLVIIPIMGIALVYVLETQVLLSNMSTDLMSTAALVARLSENQAGLWNDPAQAQAFVDKTASDVNARILLLDGGGRLLASSDPADRAALGQRSAVPGMAQLLAGHSDVRTAYSPRLSTEVVAAAVPVFGTNKQIVGVVRLTHPWTTVYARFLRLRYLIAAILVVGMILGSAVGWVLALNLEQPLVQLTGAVGKLAASSEWSPVVEDGPNEVRQLVRTVNDLVERLHMLERNRRQLLANLVHELGRPLGSVGLAVQALRRGADQDLELRDDLLAGIDGEIIRLRRLLDDLARLYDQVAGTLQLACHPTPLSDWLPHVLPVWRAAAEGKGLHWEAQVPDSLPTLNIDPDRLGQALGNLLSNAIKYTPTGGQVCVGAGCEPKDLWISVADTGPGIPIEKQAQVFEPFQRGADGRPFPQGMGLGLAIARDLVNAHGGHINLESQPGQGSRFTIWLPLVYRD